jgi:lincosamide nucleotidyltransferase A/C/D/E
MDHEVIEHMYDKDSSAHPEPQRRMEAADVLQLLGLLDQEHIDAWLDGGWGVDALLGEQTRPHEDVDLIVRVDDVAKMCAALEPRGLELVKGDPWSNFVLDDHQGHEIDVHPVKFSDSGDGIYRMANGKDWVFPAPGFSGRGYVRGREVRCLSPEVQVLCHAHGYEPGETDFNDMAALQKRFGVELPDHLQR